MNNKEVLDLFKKAVENGEPWAQDIKKESERYRQNEYRHERCNKPKWYLCKMDCRTCKYQRMGDFLSLDSMCYKDTNTSIEFSDDSALDTFELFYFNDAIERAERGLRKAFKKDALELKIFARLIDHYKNKEKQESERAMAECLNIAKTTLHEHKMILVKFIKEHAYFDDFF